MKAQLDKLVELAAECSVIASHATGKQKCDLFAGLAQHYSVLADQVLAAMKEASGSKPTTLWSMERDIEDRNRAQLGDTHR